MADSPDVLTVEQSRVSDILRRTAPWVRLVSVVMFISCALMLVGGVIFAIAMGAGMAAAGRPGGAVPAVVGSLVYCGMGLVNLIPAVFLMRFASRAKAYVVAQTVGNLEQALDAQRSYWKFMGIFMIVAFVGAIFMVVAIGIGAFWFARSRAGQ